jgi:hypothetical protein
MHRKMYFGIATLVYSPYDFVFLRQASYLHNHKKLSAMLLGLISYYIVQRGHPMGQMSI